MRRLLGDVGVARVDLDVRSLAKELAQLARDAGSLSDGLADVDRVRAVVGDLALDVAFTWELVENAHGGEVGGGEVRGEEGALDVRGRAWGGRRESVVEESGCENCKELE